MILAITSTLFLYFAYLLSCTEKQLTLYCYSVLRCYYTREIQCVVTTETDRERETEREVLATCDAGELLLALGGQIQALHDLVEKRFYDQECLLQEMAPMVAQCASRALAQPRIREPSRRHVSEKGNGDLNRLGSAAQSFVRENMAEYGARSIEVANHRAETISAPENVQQGKGTRSLVKDIVSSSWFAIAITFLISLNLILLGLEVDTTASLLDVSDTPNWFGIVNVLIAAW